METAFIPGSLKTIATKTLTGAVEQITTTRTPCTGGVIVQADLSNPVGTYVEIGGPDLTAGNGLQLGPGASIGLTLDDTGDVWVIGTATHLVRMIAVGA